MIDNVNCLMDNTTSTMIGKSPLTRIVQVQRERAKCDVLSGDAGHTRNQYHCPGVLDVLIKNDMGIVPLWSGLLLGDISWHLKAEDKKVDVKYQTGDTSCHVELWFSLVQQSSLQKKQNLRPAEFVSKMYDSIQGRYIEHVMCYGQRHARWLLPPGDTWARLGVGETPVLKAGCVGWCSLSRSPARRPPSTTAALAHARCRLTELRSFCSFFFAFAYSYLYLYCFHRYLHK